jgi:hypothetical protein
MDISIQYILETIISALTFVPFFLLAIVSIRMWLRTRKEKKSEQQNNSFHFHIQLFLAGVIHSISFTLPPHSIGEKLTEKETIIGVRGFDTPFSCFIQAYLNIFSIETTLFISNFISIIGYLMISMPETISTKKLIIKLLSYIICWVFPMVMNIFVVGYTKLATVDNSNFCWFSVMDFSFWQFKIVHIILFLGYLINIIVLRIKIKQAVGISEETINLLKRLSLMLYINIVLVIILIFSSLVEIDFVQNWSLFMCDVIEILVFPFVVLLYSVTTEKLLELKEMCGCDKENIKVKQDVKFLMEQSYVQSDNETED